MEMTACSQFHPSPGYAAITKSSLARVPGFEPLTGQYHLIKKARAPRFELGIADPKSAALPLGHARSLISLQNRRHVAIIPCCKGIDKVPIHSKITFRRLS